jgi:hypothetical protein
MSAGDSSTSQASLPQLSGRLAWFYRIAWCALAIGAVVASSELLVQAEPNAAIVSLRLVKSTVLICVATILLYRRQRDPVAALLALAFLTWTITSSFDFLTGATPAQLLDRCRFLLFTLALLLFPDGRMQPGWIRPAMAASFVVFLIGVVEALRVLATHLFLPFAIVCVLAAIASLVARFRASPDYALKQQLKWVALGLIAGVGLILCARAGVAASVARFPSMPVLWEALFQLGIIIVALGFLVSLLRYRLFDAETVITRSAAYATLTIALVATFGGTKALIQNIGQDYLGMNVGSVSGGMAAAVAAVLLNPFHERITGWAEQHFQPDLAQLKREIPGLLARLGTSNSTRQLCDAVLPRMSAAIHATRSAILLDSHIVAATGVTLQEAHRLAIQSFGESSYRSRGEKPDETFPVRLPLNLATSGMSAWLLFGPRPDGTLYGKEDLDAVRSNLAALQNALIATRAREAIAAAIERRDKHLRLEMDRILLRLQALERLSKINISLGA